MRLDVSPTMRRFLLSRRGLACSLWLTLGTLLLTANIASAVELEALVGFGQSPRLGSRYRPGGWTPLTVYMTGQGTSGVGQLQVIVNNGQRKTVYTRRVSLRDGAMNEAESFVVLFQNPDPYGMFRGGLNSDILIQLLKDGRKLAEKKVALPTGVNPETYNVLALTRDGSGMNFLQKKKLGLTHRYYNPQNLQQQQFQRNGGEVRTPAVNPLASLQTVYTDPRALPTMAQGYEMIDAVALADQPLDNLTEDQTEALKQYVRQGGLLIVSGGGDLARLKSQFYIDVLPVQPTGIVTARDIPELAKRYKAPLELREPIALTGSTLRPDATLLFGEDKKAPLVSSRPYGAGVVVFTAFDYLAPELRGWKGASALWRDLLRSGNLSVSPRDLLESHGHFTQGDNLILADALAGRQATSAPAFSTVALFIGAYLFLLIPLNYFILKKMDKREFAWITAPILILGFTAISYTIALSIKGGMLTVHRAVVYETAANSDQAAGYAQMSLYSPRRAGYDIAIGPDDASSPYRAFAPSEIFSAEASNLTGELTVDHDKTTVLRNTLVKLWDKRSFDTPVPGQLGGPVEVKIKMSGSRQAHVTVTNKTRYALVNCGLINSEQAVSPIGDLAPGETKEQSITWGDSGSAVSINLPNTGKGNANFDPTDRKAETPDVTRGKIQNAMIQTLANARNNNYYWNMDTGGYGRRAHAFVGWFYDKTLDVRVDGKSAAGEQVNLLYVTLPTPDSAPPRIRAAANPFARSPYLALEDETPPGTRKSGIFK